MRRSPISPSRCPSICGNSYRPYCMWDRVTGKALGKKRVFTDVPRRAELLHPKVAQAERRVLADRLGRSVTGTDHVRSDKGLQPQFVGALISMDAADGPSTTGGGAAANPASQRRSSRPHAELTVKPEASATLKAAVSELTEPFKMAPPSFAQPPLRAGGLRLRGLHARHLRQHEDGGRSRVHRQRPSVQPPLSADVRSLPGRAHRLHAGVELGEGPGREPGWISARALLHAAAAGDEP